MRLPEIALDDALKIVGDYADVVWDANDVKNEDTMRVALALESLYQDKDVWVAEWLEQSPPKDKGTRGQPTVPDSRNRFSLWLKWRLEQHGRKPIVGSRVYELLDCAEIANAIPDSVINFRTSEINSEFQLRPLRYLKKYEWMDRIPEVVERAVEIGNGHVTNKVMRQALNEWKLEHLGGPKPATRAGKKRRADAIEKARKTRIDLERRFDEFMWDAIHGDDATRAELKGFLTHVKTVMQEAKNG